MKRPQIGLRLMLLLITLLATIFGWRAAVEQAHREDRNGERFTWQLIVHEFEKQKAEQEERIRTIDAPLAQEQIAQQIKEIDERIADTKKRIDNVGK
jgi:hypothetical protein